MQKKLLNENIIVKLCQWKNNYLFSLLFIILNVTRYAISLNYSCQSFINVQKKIYCMYIFDLFVILISEIYVYQIA